MNDSERAELERLKQRHEMLLHQLQNLSRDMAALEARLAQPVEVPKPEVQLQQPVPLEPMPLQPTPPEAAPAPQPTPPTPPAITPAPPPQETPRPRPVAPRPTPPIIPRPARPVVAPTHVQAQPAQPPPQPAPIPEPARTEPVPSPPVPALETLLAQRREEQWAPPPPTEPPPPLESAAPAGAPRPKESSLELRVGTVWLVRFGIVMVLTALGLFGAYAYQNYIPRLGPGGKVGMLYFASFALLGVGTWLQRKEEKLRNYAHVLVAGGLAAVYFTTFAAYHVTALRIIHSALTDGILLLVWAGFIVWLADRKKSEIMALFAVLLAYYSSAITHAELFTLYSNLVLTLAAVFFLVRNRWATLSFASLAGTYAGYAFWRFYRDSQWQWPTEDLWPGNFFLISYWIIFTAAVFLSKHKEWDDRKRATFLSLNNGAFFTAFLLTMFQVRQHGFWKFSLIYGAVLLGLTLLAKRLRPDDKIFRNTYLTQGLVLITLGFVAHYTGLRLGLVLAAESVVLVVLGQQTQNRVLQIASYAAGALAVSLTIPHIDVQNPKGLITGAALGAAMLFNAFWLRKETNYENSTRHPQTVFFTVLTLAMWIITSWQNATEPWRALIFAAESTLVLLTARPLGNRMLSVGSMTFAGIAAACQTYEFVDRFKLADFPLSGGLWHGVLVGAFLLFNAAWYRNETNYEESPWHVQKVFFASLALLVAFELTWAHTAPQWCAFAFALEAALFLVAARPLRNRVLGLGAMTFSALAVAYQSFDFLFKFKPADFPLHDGLWQGILLVAILLFQAGWFRKETTWEQSQHHPQTIFFTVLALLACLEVTREHTGQHSFALATALESFVLLAIARPLRNRVLEFSSLAFSCLAVAFQTSNFVDQYQVVPLVQRLGWPQGAAVGALMLINALWSRRHAPPRESRTFDPPITVFCSLALIAWLGVTWTFTNPDYLAPLLALEALLFTVSFYALRLTEITLFGQAFLLLAQLLWIVESAAQNPHRPWWNPATVIAITLGVSSWWQRQKTLILRVEIRQVLQGLYALAVVGLLFSWLHPRFEPGDWLALASLLALVLTAYGVIARYWLLAAAGQILLVVSGWEFVRQLLSVKPEWYFPLAPVFVLVLLSLGTVKWFERRPDADPAVKHPLLNISFGYRVVALVMTLWWVHEYINPREQGWVLGLAGLLLFVLAGLLRSQEALIFSGIFTLSAVVRFWWPEGSAPGLYWPNLLVLLALLAQQRAAKRWLDRYRFRPELHAGVMVIAALSLWRYLYLWVGAHAQGSFYHTASWSLLALVLFVLGMAWRERVYRWLGLAVLACALGRVMTIDIWKLQKIYQIMSFMALGVVLLGLGFLYNKYQERIKEWL